MWGHQKKRKPNKTILLKKQTNKKNVLFEASSEKVKSEEIPGLIFLTFFYQKGKHDKIHSN